MKIVIYCFIAAVCCSCNFFNVKKTNAKNILAEELKTFNWSEVDIYPSFENCKDLDTETEKKDCFYKTITNSAQETLLNESLLVNKPINDTILIHFQIDSTGKIQIINTKIDALIIKEIPQIHSLFENCFNTLPKIYPAIKRGQQVKTQFTLPIYVQVE